MKWLNKIILLLIATLSITSCDFHTENIDRGMDQKLLDLFVSSSLDQNVVKIYDINEFQIIHEVQDGWENGWSENRTMHLDTGDELCRGGGLSFARCVRDAVDEGKCVKVYKDGDEYVGEEMSCNGDVGFQE